MSKERVIVVGDISSVERAGLGHDVEIVSSLEEAMESRRTSGPARIIIDQSYLQSTSIEMLTDITEPKKPEQTPAESEEKYRTLFNRIGEGFVLAEMVWDEQGNPIDFLYLDLNPAYEKNTGIPIEKAIGKRISEVIPGIEPYWAEAFGEVVRTGQPTRFTNYIADLNRWFDVYAFKHSENKFAVLFMDVTERKQTQAELEKRERDYRTLAENAPEVIARFDRQLRHTYVNEYGVKVYGVPREEVIGKTNAELGMPLDKVAFWRKHFEEVLETGKQQTVDFDFNSPNLGHQYFSSIFVPEFDGEGGVESILAITRDVTELRKAEEALRESEKSVRRKLDSILSPEGDIGTLELGDIMDAGAVQSLMDSFYKLTGIPMSIIDLKGNVLVGVGWQDICTKFHRVHPETCWHCMESDVLLTEGVAQGEFKLYKCKNNMWDVATPVMIGGKHVGNIFSGQFLFEDETPDYELFRQQARQYGFDEEEYIAALDRVPRLSREALNEGMSFFMELADMLSKLGYSNIKLAQSLAERDSLMSSLSENEERLRAIFDNAGVGIVEVDANDIFISANARALDILGYTREELLGMTVHDLTAPEDRGRSDDMNARLHDGEFGRFNYEKRYLRGDGSPIWANVTVSALRDVRGRHTGAITTIEDISERKQAEEALRGSEEKFRAVFEQAAVGMGRVSFHDARWIDVNDAFCRILGYSPEEFKITPWPQITHPNDVDLDLLPFARMAAGELDSYSVEKRFIHKQGHYVWARLTLSLVRDEQGRPDYEIAIIEDISERKQAEEALTRAREEAEHRSAELESFMANLADGVVITDVRGNLVYINDKGRAILGMPEGVTIRNWITSFKRYRLNGEELPPEETATARALRGETVTDLRYRWDTKWKEVTLSASAAPVRDHEDRVTGATIVFRDAAERVEQERKREELLEREHRIADVLQKALIPPDVPTRIGDYRVAVRYQSALREAEIGGDFYDVFEIDNDKIAVLIGDVAGKGLPAAIRVAAARYAIRSYAYLDPGPARVMQLANEALCRDKVDESGMLTAFLAIVDTNTGVVTYSSAGHEPPVIVNNDGSVEELTGVGVPLSVVSCFDYGETSRTFMPGEKIVMVTDGITEARNEYIELYGQEGVVAYILESAGLSADEIAGGLLESARAHAGGHLQDDAAILVIEHNGKGG